MERWIVRAALTVVFCCPLAAGCSSTPTWANESGLQKWVNEGVVEGTSIADARLHLRSRGFEASDEWDGTSEWWRRVDMEGFGVDRVYRVRLRRDGEIIVGTFSDIAFVGL